MSASPKRGHNWRGGVSIHPAGYRSIWMPEHPNAGSNGHVLEHQVVASAALGRAIPPGVVVHHHNDDPLDNRPSNLVICHDQAYHMLLHQRTRALRASGNASWRKCRYCKEYDSPEALKMPTRPGRSAYHLACSSHYARERRKRKNQENAA